MILDGLFPFSERIMPLDDGRNIGLEIAVNLEDSLRVERFGGHS